MRPGWPRSATARRVAVRGVVLVLTFGAGIGSALFINGVLGAEWARPNCTGTTPSGRSPRQAHLSQPGGIGWKEWATHRVQPYLQSASASCSRPS